MQSTYRLEADMPGPDYHSDPAASSGFLKTAKNRSWAHAQHGRLHPHEPTPAMAFGTAWHAAFFEPAKFEAEFVTVPEGLDRRTKEGKALWAELTASGRTPLSHGDSELIGAMVGAAKAHPIVRTLLGCGGLAEPSIFGTHPATGAPVRVRPDLLIPPCALFPHGCVVDGKTTTDAGAEQFARTIWQLDYGLQAALYVDSVQRLYGTAEPPPFLWIAVEKDAPHGVAVYAAGDDLLAHCAADLERLLAEFATCSRTSVWPGYPTTVAPIAMPAWAQKQMQEAA
jgi:exodeoxyribonuclease VIII